MNIFSKYLSFSFLLFLFFNHFVGVQPNQGEYSNYADAETFQAHVDYHLKDIPHAQNISLKEELYYLFKIHDFDKDGYLDGHELWNALTDFNVDAEEPKVLFSEVKTIVDRILTEDDINNDGFISLDEYWLSQEHYRSR